MNEKNTSQTSVLSWIIAIVLMAIPIINIILTVYWAFSGPDITRRNFFKALIVIWSIIIIGFLLIAATSNNGINIQLFGSGNSGK